jgi:ATP-dependent protease HslVU (ClpYQ) peptidase subunit
MFYSYIASEVTGSTNTAINLLARCGKEASLFYAACLAMATNDSTKEQRTDQWLKKLKDRLSKKKSDETVEETN